MRTKLLFFIIAISFAGSIFGQSPQAVKYQTVIRDNNGDIVADQPVSIRLSFLQGSPSGTAVYVETHSDTTNQFGLVNLQAGNGDVVSGDFSAIDWRNGPYYIQTEIDASGGTNYILAGTSEVLSVPYAQYSNLSAETEQLHIYTTSITTTNDWTNQTTCAYLNLPNKNIISIRVISPHGVKLGYKLGHTRWGTNWPIWNELGFIDDIDEYVRDEGVPMGASATLWPFVIVKADRLGGGASYSLDLVVVYMD